MLDLRPGREHCDTDPGPGDPSARICTFGCTFCARCADELFGGVCPNCSGELLPRPLRPIAMLDEAPSSATVHRVLRYRISDGPFRECWLYDDDQRLVDHLWRPDDAA